MAVAAAVAGAAATVEGPRQHSVGLKKTLLSPPPFSTLLLGSGMYWDKNNEATLHHRGTMAAWLSIGEFTLGRKPSGEGATFGKRMERLKKSKKN
jgi:hypothetical protein